MTDQAKAPGRENLPPRIERRLRSLARAAGAGLLASGLGRLLLAGEAFFFATLGMDRTFELEKAYRAVLLAAGILLLGRILWKNLLRPLLEGFPRTELALALERSHPFLKQALVTALQLSLRPPKESGEGESPVLARLAVEEEERLAQATRTARALEWRKLKLRLLALGAALLLAAGIGTLLPETLALWFRRDVLLQDVPWPRSTRLTILGTRNGAIYTPKGEDLVVLVRAEGILPRRGWISWKSKEGGGEARLSRLGRDRFRHTFKAVAESLVFTVRAGDGRAGPIRVIPVARPRVLELRATLREPAYTGRPPKQIDLLKGEATLPVLLGSSILLEGRSDKELSAAFLASGGERIGGRVDRRSRRRFTFALRPRKSLRVRILPRDALGLEPSPAPEACFQVLLDAPPEVTLTARGVGLMVTPRVRIPLVLKARDDVALSALEIQVWAGRSGKEGRNFRPAQARGLEAFRPGAARFEGDLLWTRGELSLEPGMNLALRARGRDNFAPGPPHQGESAVLEFRVVSPEVLRKDLARRQEEVRSRLEALQESLQALRKDLEKRKDPLGGLPAELQEDAGMAGGAAGRLAAVLDEWENNRLTGWERVPSLRETILRPLEGRAAPALEDGAGRAAAWLAGTPEAAEELKEDLDRALEALARTLANLARIESFQRVLEITRSLLRTQGEARRALQKKVEKSLEDLFGEKKR